MDLLFVQSPIGVAIIGRQVRAIFDVIGYECLQSLTLSILKNLSSHFAATFQNSTNDNFVRAAFRHSRRSQSSAFVFVHESGLTANESLINFNVVSASTKFSPVLILHCESDSVKHEPCGFLSDADCTVNLVRGNAILAVGYHPCSSEPFVEANGTVLKYGSYLDAELFLGVFGLALPNAASGNEFHVLASASWTDNTIGPTLRHKMIQAVVEIGVEDDCGLQGLRLFHSKTRVPEKGYCVKYINADDLGCRDIRRLEY